MELFTENPETKRRLPLKLEENAAYVHACGMLRIMYADAGRGVVRALGRDTAVNAPAIICLNERESLEIAPGGTLCTKLLYFSPSVINSAFDSENIREDINCLPETAKLDHYYFRPFLGSDGVKVIRLEQLAAGRLTAVFEALKARLADFGDSYWPCRSRSHLIELLFFIQQSEPEQRTKSNALKDADTDVPDILHYLNMNYNRRISIDELSKNFRTNRNSLSRRFKDTTGQSVFEYLVKIRLDAACSLLRNTTLPVAEIADRVGFSDLSYWGRAFRRQTGSTPSDYRKKACYPHAGL